MYVKYNDLIPGPTHIVSLSLNFLKLHSNELFSGILSILSTMFRYLYWLIKNIRFEMHGDLFSYSWRRLCVDYDLSKLKLDWKLGLQGLTSEFVVYTN